MSRRFGHGRAVRWIRAMVWGSGALGVAFLGGARAAEAAGTSTSPAASVVLEAAGRVEWYSAVTTNWLPASVGLKLRAGDRLRTRERSRAAVQLSDRSVIRLQERTTLQLLAPRGSEKRRFGLPSGALYFFNRERPADIEFETPLAAGAIRGTEFLLAVAEAASSVRLALIDGLVTLSGAAGEIELTGGEDLVWWPGQAPQRAVLRDANAAIQWALYYPAVVDPDELDLTGSERRDLRAVVEAYRSGDGLAALAAWPESMRAESESARVLHAAVELAVGRVAEATARLGGEAGRSRAGRALAALMACVKGGRAPAGLEPQSASEFLARSYGLQAQGDVVAARRDARRAVECAPRLGMAWARLAELAFACGDRRAALEALGEALARAPRLASAQALRGFVWLEGGDTKRARVAFDRARELEAGYAGAWVGEGLCAMRERRWLEARAAFQAAAALEPQRAMFRSYLGKVASELGDSRAAHKEFDLAKRLDARDPTGWFYSALHLWQQNRINESIRDLEQALDRNEEPAIFRSRRLLDGDRSVRSADLAALYREAGLTEVSARAAARAVAEDYANFSGHLFLANSYQALEDERRFDLRLETVRQSELLVANLLAPAGAGNLSQQLSQHEHLRWFEPRPAGVSSLTRYGSGGDWSQAGTWFGSVDGLSYAVEGQYQRLNGQRPNAEAERRQFAVTVKQRVTAEDEFYAQAGLLNSQAGDLGDYYDPTEAKPGFQVRERQDPTLYAGWHHTWSPGNHTLFLASRLSDVLGYDDPQPSVLFLRQSGGATTAVETPPLFHLNLASEFTLYSAEVQQVWAAGSLSGVLGGRWQSGQTDSRAVLSRALTGPVTDQSLGGSLHRGDAYGYVTWRVAPPLQLVAGVNYSRIRFPANLTQPPVSEGESTREELSPKAAVLLTPWDKGRLRLSYARSLGGLTFDNSVRLEPTQLAGFNQAFRSLIPESESGLVPGTRFDTAGIGFEQAWGRSTWWGVEFERLSSAGERTVGVLTNSTVLPIPDRASATRQRLDFDGRSASVYAAQLWGDWFSCSARYRYAEAALRTRFPQVPNTAAGLAGVEQDERAHWQELTLGFQANHASGLWGRWESAWYHQRNSGYDPALGGEDLWQHHLLVGFRWPRRYAELQLGVLNLLDTDYRLNPLNLHGDLPRHRTYTASLRLNF